MLSNERNGLAGNIAGDLHIGIQGPPGPQGPQGVPGKEGGSTTITLKYGVSSTPSMNTITGWQDTIPQMSEAYPYLWIEISTETTTATGGSSTIEAGIIGYYSTPDSGGNVDQVSVEPAEDDIPDVHFIVKGGMPFTKYEGDVQVLMRYISKTATIERYCTAKVQGSSSASTTSYKKRNWTIKIYKDSTYEEKEKLSFKGWPAMNKFVLKAGWVIPGHLRNVGAAKIWGQIMRSRSDYDSLPEELRNSPNQGATDGFHVRVFINGMYWGIYDWIVAKDQLFGQDKDNAAHSILNSELNNQPTCAFATTSPVISGNWSEELLDSMTTDTKTSMENWIKFVAGSTDEEFVANAENYFDVQSVIDASCFDRIIMTVDNMCRNQIVFKYDTKWYMGKWDLDAILGLPPVAGQTWYTYDTAYQEGYVAHKDYGIINMLYDRTEKLFLERFKANYWRLRSGPLSEANLVEVFGRLSDRLRSIDGLLAEENASTTGNGQFTGMPNVNTDTIQQIREMVVKRCAFMDEVIENMVGSVPCTGIALSATELIFTGTGTQTLTATVEPENTTDSVVWSIDETSVATVSGGVVQAKANGNATITATCGRFSATCDVVVSGIEVSSPAPIIHLESSSLVSESVTWEDESGNGNDFTLTNGTPNVNDSGLLLTSCKVHGNDLISLSGAFTADFVTTVYTNTSNNGDIAAFYAFNDQIAYAGNTKYADSVSRNAYKMNGYSGDTITDFAIERDKPYHFTVVRDNAGNTQLYVDGKLHGEYNRGTFNADGSFGITLGCSSFGGFPNTFASFRIDSFKLFDRALNADEIAQYLNA